MPWDRRRWYSPLPVNGPERSSDPPAHVPGGLDPPFALLRDLLARSGRFARLEDLQGMSGILFRTYWHLRIRESAPRRWSSRSAEACSGDPIARAAEAYGVRLARGDVPGLSELEPGIETIEGSPTIERRIDFLRRSIRTGIDYSDEKELRREGIFAAGAAAYGALLEDLSRPLSSFLPESAEEAARLVPEAASLSLPEEVLPPLSLAVALRRTLRAFGTARLRLAGYLDRAGNFIDSSASLSPFVKEGEALLRAGDRIAGPSLLDLAAGAGADGALDSLLGAKVLSSVRRDVGAAAAEHRKGIDRLRRAFPR
ncbi:MAG: hypothetical protein ABIH26_09300 [Candidatus Eisenbacteria bacterium]